MSTEDTARATDNQIKDFLALRRQLEPLVKQLRELRELRDRWKADEKEASRYDHAVAGERERICARHVDALNRLLGSVTKAGEVEDGQPNIG